MDAQLSFDSVTDGYAVGVAMRLARRRLGLSQRGLAEALGWDRAKVGRWESGLVPEGFEQVVGLLRVLGFGLELTDPHAHGWAAFDDPAEHVADRAGRRFPAHLELCGESAMSTWNWTRHRGEPSPLAAHTSFRRRTQAQVVTEDAAEAMPRPSETADAARAEPGPSQRIDEPRAEPAAAADPQVPSRPAAS